MVTTERLQRARDDVDALSDALLSLQRARESGTYDGVEWREALLRWSLATHHFKTLVKEAMVEKSYRGRIADIRKETCNADQAG